MLVVDGSGITLFFFLQRFGDYHVMLSWKLNRESVTTLLNFLGMSDVFIWTNKNRFTPDILQPNVR